MHKRDEGNPWFPYACFGQELSQGDKRNFGGLSILDA